METVTIEIKNQSAYQLLKNLEDLKIIRVLKSGIQSKQKLSEKYAGRLSSSVADEMQEHIQLGREQWNKKSI
jgi:hypothetical protein